MKRHIIRVDSFWSYGFFVNRRFIEEILWEIERELGQRLEVELVLADDVKVVELNKRFLNTNSPTNVLSFPDSKSGSGSVIVSLETVLRESILYNQRPEEHLTRVIVHGVLHILGIDHGPFMFDMTEKLVKNLGQTLYNIP